MSNIQIIQCQKASGSFDTVDAAMAQHCTDCTALTSVSDYKAWVGQQLFSESYALMADNSGYNITRTWETTEAKEAGEAGSAPDNDRAQLSVNGWTCKLI